jgi:hypothetical protein
MILFSEQYKIILINKIPFDNRSLNIISYISSSINNQITFSNFPDDYITLNFIKEKIKDFRNYRLVYIVGNPWKYIAYNYNFFRKNGNGYIGYNTGKKQVKLKISSFDDYIKYKTTEHWKPPYLYMDKYFIRAENYKEDIKALGEVIGVHFKSIPPLNFVKFNYKNMYNEKLFIDVFEKNKDLIEVCDYNFE